MKRNKKKGFTLVEMIVALVIFAFLGGALYTTFGQGLKIWHHAVRERAEWKIDLFFEELTEGLRNFCRDRETSFVGSKHSVQFDALTPRLVREGGETSERIMRLPVSRSYAFDEAQKVITGYRKSYPEILSPPKLKKDPAFPVVEGVSAFDLEYYYYDPDRETRTWTSQWKGACPPEAVKISIGDEEGRRMTRYLNIPSSRGCV